MGSPFSISSGIFGQLINAFDLASKMDHLRMAEQSTRLAQQRATGQAQATTVQATVSVHTDGFDSVRKSSVALTDAPAPVEFETRERNVEADPKASFRRNEMVDAELQAQAALFLMAQLNQK